MGANFHEFEGIKVELQFQNRVTVRVRYKRTYRALLLEPVTRTKVRAYSLGPVSSKKDKHRD